MLPPQPVALGVALPLAVQVGRLIGMETTMATRHSFPTKTRSSSLRVGSFIPRVL